MTIVIQKFGGSSLASIGAIQRVADKIIRSIEQGVQVIAVVSAMGKDTERLLSLAKSAAHNPHERELALLLSCGEQISASLLTMALNDRGMKARAMTGLEAGIQTSGHYYQSRIMAIEPQAIFKALARQEIPVVCGFQGVNEAGEVTILERGGSDATAVALASATHAVECQIYTDVDGVYTADPHLLPEARRLPSVSVENMLAMAQHGARVVQAYAVELAARYQVAVRVLSTENSGGKGTSVALVADQAPFCSIAVAYSVSGESAALAAVSLIGATVSSHATVRQKVAKILNSEGIKVYDTRVSAFALSILIKQNDVLSMVRKLHNAFFLTEEVGDSNFERFEETKLCEKG